MKTLVFSGEPGRDIEIFGSTFHNLVNKNGDHVYYQEGIVVEDTHPDDFPINSVVRDATGAYYRRVLLGWKTFGAYETFSNSELFMPLTLVVEK